MSVLQTTISAIASQYMINNYDKDYWLQITRDEKYAVHFDGNYNALCKPTAVINPVIQISIKIQWHHMSIISFTHVIHIIIPIVYN
jgi:hypothetical protein